MTAQKQTKENFEELLNEFSTADSLVGRVLKGMVIGVQNGYAVVDVGLKSEGRIAIEEFNPSGLGNDVKVGDEVEVYLERMENRDGMVQLSREKARREEAWIELESAFNRKEQVKGVIFNRVKGGFTVDLNGAIAFLPGSQLDLRPIKDITPLMGKPQPFVILKMDRARGNIVVSRRAILEEERAEARGQLMENLAEGQTIDGTVKNITDYGAFVDLGGIDGLLHVTDISWQRINHPSESLKVGQEVKVLVTRINEESQRISLGMKQLETDPWEGVSAKYPAEMKIKGKVTNMADYGAFVELESGIEGLVHVSEMSWTKKNLHPGKMVSVGEEIEAMILEVDEEKRRISLGLKQCQENPWDTLSEKFKVGDVIEGEVKNATEFGLFVGLDDDIDGMIHLNDLSWDQPGEEAVAGIEKGSKIKAKILEIDAENGRIALGVKQLEADPFAEALGGAQKGDVVTCVVTDVTDNGLVVSVRDTLEGFIKRSDLARERADQRPDRFAVGEKVDAKLIAIDKRDRKLTLSIKAREIADDKKAIEEYGSSDSGASLGDILGAALDGGKK